MTGREVTGRHSRTTTPPSSDCGGADFARRALHQAQQAAKQHGGRITAPRPRRRGLLRRDGRDPAGFSAVLHALVAERAWDVPAAGGSVVDRWPQIAADAAPALVGHTAAVAFDAEARRLDVRPDSAAYATQLRLYTGQILTAAARVAGDGAVRTLRVLPPGSLPLAGKPAVEAARPEPAPIRTRESACAGYHQALAAHRAAAPPRHRLDAAIAAAAERQDQALRIHREPQPPEPPTPEEAPALARRGSEEAVRAAALRRARAERAGRARARVKEAEPSGL